MSAGSTARPSAADRARSPGIVAPLLAAALIAAAVVVARSPFFSLRSIAVSGNRILSAEEVRSFTGLSLGTNLNAVSISEVRERVMSSSWIMSADVSRDLPRTIVVRVRERTPVGLVSGAGGGAGIGSDAVVVARAGEVVARVGRVPELGSAPGKLEDGTRVRIRRELLAIAGSFPDRLRRAVRSIAIRGDEATLSLAQGGLVRYGRVTSLDQKNAAILSMIRYARRRSIEIAYIDVRSPAAPALRPAAVSSEAS